MTLVDDGDRGGCLESYHDKSAVHDAVDQVQQHVRPHKNAVLFVDIPHVTPDLLYGLLLLFVFRHKITLDLLYETKILLINDHLANNHHDVKQKLAEGGLHEPFRVQINVS